MHEWQELTKANDGDLEARLIDAIDEAPVSILRFLDCFHEYWRFQRFKAIETRGDERVVDAADTIIRKLETFIKRHKKER